MSAPDHGHDDHGHGHAGQSRFIQHHYDDALHQFNSGKLGIWIFLGQEVLFFSALFVAYILYRVHHPEVYGYAHKWLDVKYGATNTAVLITSSLTAAWAVRAAQLNRRKQLIGCLAATIVFACCFLGIKYLEYSHKWHEQILYGRYFDPCISPGGEEMITRKNKCAGTKSTVIYSPADYYPYSDDDNGKPTAGCFDVAKIDLEPDRPGIQAKCQVTEVKLDDKGKPTGVTRPITAQCDDPLNDALERIEGGGVAEESHEKKETFPCWRPSYQPWVCPDGTTPDQRLHGVGSKPTAGILVEYGDREERFDVRIEAKCDAPKAPAAAPADAAEGAPAVPGLGQRSIKPIHEITTAEQHELEELGPPPEHTNMFLTVYFAMTGLHGIHVFIGILVFIWLLRRAIRGDFTPDYFGPVDFSALYWHIVDLIWIFLFPLLYLIH